MEHNLFADLQTESLTYHRRGHWFKSSIAHIEVPTQTCRIASGSSSRPYTVSLRFIVTNDIEKKRIVSPMIRASAQRRLS